MARTVAVGVGCKLIPSRPGRVTGVRACDEWRPLDFTVSPRCAHSAKMGSRNYTIMLDPDYIELLGVLAETEHNAPTRSFLADRGEGIERIAFTAIDSAAGAEEVRARGYAA